MKHKDVITYKIKGVVWPPCLAILCYMDGDVGHVVCVWGGGGGECRSRRGDRELMG